MEALEHEQRANTPMLMAMAFLTTAASAVFAAAYQRLWQQDQSIAQLLQCHPMLAAFALFIVLILIGTAFSVAAQRSQLELPKNSEETTNKNVPRSLIFWKMIPEMKQNDWTNFIVNSNDDTLITKISEDFAREAYLVSKLVAHKHQQRGNAAVCFQLALVAFGFFVGLALNVVFSWGLIWAIVFGLAVIFVLAWLKWQQRLQK